MRVPKVRVVPLPEQGPAIRAARLSRGLSQAQLARLVDVSTRYIKYLEHNTYCPTGIIAARLRMALGIDIPLPPRPPQPVKVAKAPPPPPAPPAPRVINGFRPYWT